MATHSRYVKLKPKSRKNVYASNARSPKSRLKFLKSDFNFGTLDDEFDGWFGAALTPTNVASYVDL